MGALSGLVFPVLSQRQAALGQMNTHVEESLKAFRACKAGGRMDENNRRMEGLSQAYYDRCLRASRLEYMLGPLMLVLGNLNFLLTVSFGASRILSGVITVGTMQAFVMYSRQFMEPLNAMSDYFVQAQSAMAGAERVFRLIDHANERQEIASARGPAPAQRDGESGLTFEDVRFAYHRNMPVLRGMNLSLKPGERLALVGRTGAGKTTMVQLLLLFYANYQGQIRLDGREIRQMDPVELRSRFAVVSQEPRIVEGSLCDNLMYGCEGVDRAQVERAVREIGAEAIIARLPQGLDTPMGSVGDDLSQGQLQMICLIRALLRDASVLILDEATSSMDPETEDSIKRGMDAAMAGRTCIVIAHRLSSVWDADHIAVLSDGVIGEYGTHDALMARRGTYYQLYHKQLSGKEI
jgi:ATP-binding cassette subfamily B protein